MKGSRIACIIILVLSILLASTIWYIISREKIEKALENFRRRRDLQEMNTTTTATVTTLSQDIENLFAATLGKLLISCPEDVMKFIEKENFGCKEINKTLNVFKRNYKGEFRNDNAYIRLYHALKKFNRLLCGENEKYRRFFIPIQDDFVKLHELFEDCKGPPDWYEKNVTSCVEAQSILECYYEAIGFEMDNKIAFYYDHIFRNVINAAMNSTCKFKAHPAERTFKILNSSSTVVSASSIKLIVFLILSLLVLFWDS